MTPEQIALVRQSFAKLQPALPEVGREFYVRLFYEHPELRELFHGDMERQSRALMAMMQLVVNLLDLQDKLVPVIHYLGERHATLGVKPEYYPPFCAALVDSLEAVLRDDFTPDTRRAWETACAFMIDNMT